MTISGTKIYESSSLGVSSEESFHTSKTIYEKMKMIYTRSEERFLNVRYYSYFPVKNLFTLLKAKERYPIKFNIFKLEMGDLTFWEYRKGQQWVGILTENFDETNFELWFIKLLLLTSSVEFPEEKNMKSDVETNLVAELFVKELKNTTEFDEWEFGGSEYFMKVVKFFTSRNTTIQAVLPAFPCKSSNLEKVSGSLPDRGEKMALERLLNFSQSVKNIYSPGIKIWIVSDGHVFSDCSEYSRAYNYWRLNTDKLVAVDDEQVDVYSKSLIDLYENLKPSDEDPIQFCSLVDIFSLKELQFYEDLVAEVQIGHYLNTKLQHEAELCRKILVHSCDTDSGSLSKDINTPNHPRLFLYRGFSRFMSEDLEFHPIAKELSRKKFKKTISKIAFEMIKRNDAYSNLVELVFPFCLRFSIHAHKNSGPKFGIRLLNSDHCLVINSLEDHNTPILSDFLHIPTPWHNSIVEIDNKKTVYAIKSGHIKNGIQEGRGSGGWNSQKMCFEFKNIKLG